VSKPSAKILLVPGAAGWEIWTGQPEFGFTPHELTTASRAGELTSLPPGEVTMLFPVRSTTALPLKVTTADDSLFPELAAMHAERLGLRPDPMAGQLTDTFVIARDGEQTALLSVHLRPPAEGDLPLRGPKEFDLSARAFPVTGDCLAIWQEFGRWVFAFYHQGKALYCQATSIGEAQPGDDLVREIRLAQIQLSLQGIELEPSQIELWTTEIPDTTALAAAFRCPVNAGPRPSPVLPEPRSKLLPADVRAARRAAQQRQTIILAVAAVVLAYLGLIGWLGYGLWQTSQETKLFLAEANRLAPDAADYQTFLARWDELEYAVDVRYSPVELLAKIHKCIPAAGGLRLKSAEITAREITLVGEAQQESAVGQFSLALSKSPDLNYLKWQTPSAVQSPRGWDFTFTAAPPQS
jgi:Tfp pilus assembly protein PilN